MSYWSKASPERKGECIEDMKSNKSEESGEKLQRKHPPRSPVGEIEEPVVGCGVLAGTGFGWWYWGSVTDVSENSLYINPYGVCTNESWCRKDGRFAFYTTPEEAEKSYEEYRKKLPKDSPW